MVQFDLSFKEKTQKTIPFFTCRLVKDGDVFGEDKGCKESNKYVDKMCLFEHLGCVKPQLLWCSEDADSRLRMKFFVH